MLPCSYEFEKLFLDYLAKIEVRNQELCLMDLNSKVVSDLPLLKSRIGEKINLTN